VEGNNYGLGETRKKELHGSCAALGIKAERCIALDRMDLQDNPRIWWNEDVIIGSVKKYVEKWKVDAVRLSTRLGVLLAMLLTQLQILTFDSGGISGHINHRAVSAAIRYEISVRFLTRHC
jgi:N-acetylglucosaminylphosphatidylinositol deacetylase